MGCSIFHGSSSTYDKPAQANPNPDPKKCIIEQFQQVGVYLIVLVKYLDCTTFEGRKVLVYKNTKINDLAFQKDRVGIDPHFSSNHKYKSPVARFIPTDEGITMAVKLCQLLSS